MKHITLCFLLFAFCSLVHAEQITMDIKTATDLNGTPVTYSPSPIDYTYYDLTHVWIETYNDADSCSQILMNEGVFRLSHLPSAMAYGGMSWEGFTLSTVSQDTANVFGCVANGGLEGVATPYVIGYYSEWVSSSQGYSSNIIDFNGEYYPEHVYICQNSNTHKAITQGEMYDLVYAQGEGFNKHEHYAYIRKYKQQTLLVVLNFDDHQTDIQVRIPQEAFDHLQQAEQVPVTATDLLTGNEYTFPFSPHTPVCLTLPAWKGVVLKIKG